MLTNTTEWKIINFRSNSHEFHKVRVVSAYSSLMLERS
ncbi:MAG: hypothetical protein JWP34_2370 [Massilia sp.]|nr:hypothetical protein [Massilia sp.]